jgi:hypothetical protein
MPAVLFLAALIVSAVGTTVPASAAFPVLSPDHVQGSMCNLCQHTLPVLTALLPATAAELPAAIHTMCAAFGSDAALCDMV